MKYLPGQTCESATEADNEYVYTGNYYIYFVTSVAGDVGRTGNFFYRCLLTLSKFFLRNS